jgi:hypothetical protein
MAEHREAMQFVIIDDSITSFVSGDVPVNAIAQQGKLLDVPWWVGVINATDPSKYPASSSGVTMSTW